MPSTPSWRAARALLVLAPLLAGGGLAVTAQDDATPRSAAGASGAVVTVDPHATAVGLEILQAGGNAIDATIAVGLTLAVTHPQAGNIGGGGFMVVYLADEDRYTTLDFRERAPAAATATMYLGEDGQPVRGANYVGWRAAGVPGTVAGFWQAHEAWGRLPWSRLVQPALELARDGFVVDDYLAGSFERVAPIFREHPGSAAAFLKPDGSTWKQGETFVQPDLARSLQTIADGGARAFYRGEIAGLVVAAMQANGGLIDAADMESYRAVERPPVRGTYRDYEVISMGPPSSGGVALVQMLNMLEGFEISALDPLGPRVVHLFGETMRQAYLDRATWLGDPDTVEIPLPRLLSKEYASELAAAIPQYRARISAEMGAALLTPAESEETTHYSIVDAEGNAVATTYTIEAGFGAKVVAPGTGFLLNNEMADFNAWPGRTDSRGYIGTPPNQIAGGKRPLSSMSPTILARHGRPVAVLGSPGGKTIINTVLRVVTGVIDFGLAPIDAVDLPRIHHQWMPDELRLEEGFPAETLAALAAMGHRLAPARVQGDAHVVWVGADGQRLAVADLRRVGAAAAY